MTVENMRAWVASAYNSNSWKQRVSKMPEHQIIALYSKFMQQGKFTPKSSEPKNKEIDGQMKFEL